HVLLAQVAGPHAVFATPETEVDRELVLRPSHDLADALQAHAFSEHPALDEGLLADGDPHLVLVDPGRRLAQCHHDAPPVGIGPVEGALDQRRVGHAAGGHEGVAPRRRRWPRSRTSWPGAARAWPRPWRCRPASPRAR